MPFVPAPPGIFRLLCVEPGDRPRIRGLGFRKFDMTRYDLRMADGPAHMRRSGATVRLLDGARDAIARVDWRRIESASARIWVYVVTPSRQVLQIRVAGIAVAARNVTITAYAARVMAYKQFYALRSPWGIGK